VRGKAYLASRNDGGRSTSKMEDVSHHGDHTEGGAEQTIHLQRRTQIPHDTDTDTTHYTSPSLEVNRMVSSSKGSETSSEPRSTERSDRVTVNERQLDWVSGVRKSGAASVDDATIVQRSASSVRSGSVRQSTMPRKTCDYRFIGVPHGSREDSCRDRVQCRWCRKGSRCCRQVRDVACYSGCMLM
jgi:hypothetical protein